MEEDDLMKNMSIAVENRAQVEELILEGLRDKRKGYTIEQARKLMTRRRDKKVWKSGVKKLEKALDF